MKSIITRTTCFLTSDAGLTATEYAVMLSLIVLGAMAAIALMGNKVANISTNLGTGLPDGT